MTALILAGAAILLIILLLRQALKRQTAVPMRSAEDVDGEKIVRRSIEEARRYVKARADEREAEIRAGKL